MTEKTSWAGRAWRGFVLLVLIAAVAMPIYGGVTEGGLGFLGGMYLGLVFAAIGLVLLIATIVVENIRRSRRPPPENKPELPEARINRR